MKLKLWTLLVASLTLFLNGCGGGGGGGDGSVRLVNATTDYASLDFYADTTELAPGVARNSVSAYSTLSEDTYALTLKEAGTATTVSSSSRSISSDVQNTLVAYNTNGLLTTAYLTDNEDAPTAGSAKFRVFNTSYEAGNVDVFVTSPTALLENSSPVAANLPAERASVYTEISAGSYRLRITGTGNDDDIRLDIPSIALTDQEIVTLIVTKTPGGVLVNGLLLDQQGGATAETNTTARVRVVAGAANNATVSATINGIVFANGLKSPVITPYQLVTAGTLTTSFSISGTPVTAPTITVGAGTDTTLMVLGTASAPVFSPINDVNVPSTNSTLAVKLRLVNGLNGETSPLTLTADYDPIASNITFGNASTPANVAASTTARLEVTSPTDLLPLFIATDVTLQEGKVYSLFMLGDADSTTGSPIGALRLDR